MIGLQVQALSHKDSEQHNCRTHYKGRRKRKERKANKREVIGVIGQPKELLCAAPAPLCVVYVPLLFVMDTDQLRMKHTYHYAFANCRSWKVLLVSSHYCLQLTYLHYALDPSLLIAMITKNHKTELLGFFSPLGIVIIPTLSIATSIFIIAFIATPPLLCEFPAG